MSCNCIVKLKVQFCTQRKWFEGCTQNLLFMWEGPRRPCGFAAAGSSCYKMWAGLNGFDPRTDLVFGGVRNGMGCMNLVTVISEYTQVPVTLRFKCLCISEVVSSGGGTTVVTCNLRTY